MPTATASEHVHLVYALEGDVRSVDVFSLAPTLLSLGRLIQDSSRTLNPLGEELAVNVRPFRAGSFVVDVVVFAQTAEGQGMLATGLIGAPAIIQTLRAIGLIADAKETAISLLKKLRGQKKQPVEIEPGEYRYTVGDGNVSVSGNVHQLVQNPTIVQNIQNVYGTPLADPNISAVKSFLEGREVETEVRVEKDDLSELGLPSTAPLDRALSVVSNTTTVLLNPKRIALDGEGRNWSFNRGDHILTATIRDADFLRRVSSGETRLGHTDVLKVELQETQRIEGGKIRASNEVLRVLQHIPGTPDLGFGAEES